MSTQTTIINISAAAKEEQLWEIINSQKELIDNLLETLEKFEGDKTIRIERDA